MSNGMSGTLARPGPPWLRPTPATRWSLGPASRPMIVQVPVSTPSRTLGPVTNRRATTLAPARRAAGLLAGLALGAAVLAGCSSEGARTDCGLDACTVTFDRGVDASANILGVEAKLISA